MNVNLHQSSSSSTSLNISRLDVANLSMETTSSYSQSSIYSLQSESQSSIYNLQSPSSSIGTSIPGNISFNNSFPLPIFHSQQSTNAPNISKVSFNLNNCTKNSWQSSRLANYVTNNNSRLLENSTNSNVIPFTTEIIMSVVEGRGKAKGEIGFAYLDLNRPILHVAQFMDNYSFESLKMECYLSSPVEIIFPHTFTENNIMLAMLIENFPDIDFKPFNRKYFNEVMGFQFIKEYSYDNYQWIDLQLENKYYCLAACSALFYYLFDVKQVCFIPMSKSIILELFIYLIFIQYILHLKSFYFCQFLLTNNNNNTFPFSILFPIDSVCKKIDKNNLSKLIKHIDY